MSSKLFSEMAEVVDDAEQAKVRLTRLVHLCLHPRPPHRFFRRRRAKTMVSNMYVR